MYIFPENSEGKSFDILSPVIIHFEISFFCFIAFISLSAFLS